MGDIPRNRTNNKFVETKQISVVLLIQLSLIDLPYLLVQNIIIIIILLAIFILSVSDRSYVGHVNTYWLRKQTLAKLL